MSGPSPPYWFLDELSLRDEFRVVTRGVEFDLTAEGLSPDAWVCPRLLTAPASGHPGFHFADEPTSTTPSRLSLRAAEALAAGRIILRAGDRVRVGSVVFERAADPLHHEADQEAAIVRLVREREGEVEPAGTIVMYRRGRLSDTSPSGMLDAIDARLPEDHSADELRASVATVVALQADLIEQLPPSSSRLGVRGPPDLRWQLQTLVGTAILLGYQLAELEAGRLIEPHARRRLQDVERSRQGQSKAAKSRVERWQGEVIAAANQMLENDMTLSSAGIARHIDETRRRGGDKIPGLPAFEQLVKFIRKERAPDGRIRLRPLGPSDL